MTPLNTTCPIMSTSTSRMALSLLFSEADTSRPMAEEANIMSRMEMKISTLVSNSRWFCGMMMMFTNPSVRIPACTSSTASSTNALDSTTASRLTPTEASRKMISRSLQISR